MNKYKKAFTKIATDKATIFYQTKRGTWQLVANVELSDPKDIKEFRKLMAKANQR